MREKYTYSCPVCKKQRKLTFETLNNHKEYLEKCYFCRRTETTRKSNLEKYGVICYSQTEAFKKRHKQTYDNMLEKRKLEIAEKRKLTNLKKFGVENVSQIEEVKIKKEETNLKHFGQKYFAQTPQFHKTKKAQYTYNNQSFDSKSELAFYIYYKDLKKISRSVRKVSNIFSKIKFIIITLILKLMENITKLKGNQFLKEDGTWQNPFNHDLDTLYEIKHQCVLENDVNIIYSKDCESYVNYVERKYGRNYLQQFKKV